MSKVIKNCLHCNKEFETYAKYINRGHGKFCSRRCGWDHKKGVTKVVRIPNVYCALCGKKFFRKKGHKKYSKSGLFFCCRAHKDKAQSLEFGIKELHPPHYGTSEKGTCYREKALKYLPNKCADCGWEKIPEILVVHHIDRNRKNSSLENLKVLCPTCHEITHYLEKSGKWGQKKD
jgi:hypothetical protein